MLVVHEHSRGKLIPSYINFRHQAKPFTNEDRRRNGWVANSGPIGSVSPFWNGDYGVCVAL